MLLSGERNAMLGHLASLIKGVEDFCEFDDNELQLIAALRTLRLVHYSGWIASRIPVVQHTTLLAGSRAGIARTDRGDARAGAANLGIVATESRYAQLSSLRRWKRPPNLSMLMPMVNVRKVWMLVRQDGMLVPVRMSEPCILAERDVVQMLVVRVMRVTMLMGLGVVRMMMGVMLGQVQPDAHRH